MSLVERRAGFKRDGRVNRLYVKKHKTHVLQIEANEQIHDFFAIGEPSEAFFPQLSEKEETVIYLADKVKEREEKRIRERESVATPKDMENRHREQLERYIEYEHYAGHPGNLTMAWRRFGVRHKNEILELKGIS